SVKLEAGRYRVAFSLKRGDRELLPERFSAIDKTALAVEIAPGKNEVNFDLKSQAEKPGETASAQGRVTLDGKPLGNVVLSFSSLAGKAVTVKAVTDADGRFVLPKVSVGKHKVTIAAPDDPGPGRARVVLPARYSTKSELVVDVARGENELNFDL